MKNLALSIFLFSLTTSLGRVSFGQSSSQYATTCNLVSAQRMLTVPYATQIVEACYVGLDVLRFAQTEAAVTAGVVETDAALAAGTWPAFAEQLGAGVLEVSTASFGGPVIAAAEISYTAFTDTIELAPTPQVIAAKICSVNPGFEGCSSPSGAYWTNLVGSWMASSTVLPQPPNTILVMPASWSGTTTVNDTFATEQTSYMPLPSYLIPPADYDNPPPSSIDSFTEYDDTPVYGNSSDASLDDSD